MQKILIADDEQKIRSLLSEYLTEEGFSVLLASDGAEAVELYDKNPDTALVILDVMMPKMDGWEACKEIRKRSAAVSVIMLTAKSEDSDELESFNKGADDYLSKPFSLAVLLARIHARIKQKSGGADTADKGDTVCRGELFINFVTHEVLLQGAPIELTPIEYELLFLLCSNSGKVFSRQQLLTAIWGYEYFGGERTVDTHVGRLRIKMGAYGDKYIKTIRSYGYKFET